MRILGFERGQGACNHYRILQPLYKLMQHKLADILTINPTNADNLDFVHQKILESDIIVFHRASDEKWFNFLKAAQAAGKLIVLDFDDDPFNTSPLNPAYRFWGTHEVMYKWPDGKEDPLWVNGEGGFNIDSNITRRDYFRACFRKADLVSTTTSILQDVFVKINKDTVVLPNLIDFDMYPKVECVKKEIRIGWQGGVSHYEDLFLVADAIKRIIKKYDNVKFVFLGDSRFYGLFKDIPKDKLEWHGWVQNVAYPYMLACLNLDIGICPLVDNEFNRSKSAIKFFEYSTMNTPTIASNISPYKEVIKHGETGLLAEPEDWYQSMEFLLINKKERTRLARNAYDYVFTNHNADTKAHLWKDAYEQMMKRDVMELAEVK